MDLQMVIKQVEMIWKDIIRHNKIKYDKFIIQDNKMTHNVIGWKSGQVAHFGEEKKTYGTIKT